MRQFRIKEENVSEKSKKLTDASFTYREELMAQILKDAEGTSPE